MGEDIQPECEGDRGGPEGAEEGQEGKIVLYEVRCPFFSHLSLQPFFQSLYNEPILVTFVVRLMLRRKRRMLTVLGGKLGNLNMIVVVWRRLLKST